MYLEEYLTKALISFYPGNCYSPIRRKVFFVSDIYELIVSSGFNSGELDVNVLRPDNYPVRYLKFSYYSKSGLFYRWPKFSKELIDCGVLSG